MTRLLQFNPIANTLKTIASPTRLAILLAIGDGEACVCHLEAILGKRQAYISHHLMALRQAEMLLDRRDGRFVYYRIANPALLDLVRDAERLAGVTLTPEGLASAREDCPCPQCAGAAAWLPLAEGVIRPNASPSPTPLP